MNNPALFEWTSRGRDKAPRDESSLRYGYDPHPDLSPEPEFWPREPEPITNEGDAESSEAKTERPTMIAKFHGKCHGCKKKIIPGVNILLVKGKAYHDREHCRPMPAGPMPQRNPRPQTLTMDERLDLLL